MQKIGSKMSSLARGVGVASLLFSQGVKSDEILLPPGTSLGQFPSSSIPTLQNTFATQIISDITPDPALVPLNTFRWLLVKTDSGLALTLPENYAGTVQNFGQQEKFFIRFDCNTGLPEISFDCTTWQPYTAGSPVSISREEQTTIMDISTNIGALNELQRQQQTLTTTLSTQQVALELAQEQLDSLQADLTHTRDTLATTESDLSNQEGTRNTLETVMKPEVKLRTDTHPVAENTALDDTTKTNLTQTALNTYDTSSSIAQMPAPSPRSPTSNFVPPSSADVQATLTVLSSELSRIQTQINSVNSQITAKQSEINTTQNSINATQQSFDQLTAQLTQYANDYSYWRDEYNRLAALRDSAAADVSSLKSSYATDRNRLISTGARSDVPDNLDGSYITSQIGALKTRIWDEYNAIPVAINTLGTTDINTKNLADQTSTPTTRLNSSYYYVSDFASLAKSYPATVKMFIKIVGSSSYAQIATTYTAYNTTHLAAIINTTVKPKLDKLCDYYFADKILETEKDDYLSKKTDLNTYTSDAATAFGKRQTAQNEYNSAKPLVDQRQAELTTLNQQKTTLTQQKSELETLKNTKAQLQTLYTRVKSIIDQLKQHVASHGTVTQEIENLIAQTQEIQDEIANLELIISSVEGDEAVLQGFIATTSDDITTINTSLTQTEQQLLAILNTISNLVPQDSFSRDGAILKPASEALRFFGDGYRTGYFSGTLGGLSAKFVTQYEWTQGINDIYPAYGSIQYIVNGRAYRTDAQRMNNFGHKELVNGYNADAVTKLNTCIALLNQYPAGSNEGVENFLSALKIEIAKLEASKSTNAIIKNHVTSVNDFTKKTLLQGGGYALFEQLVAKNPAFSLKIEEMVELMAQKGTIGDGTDARNDLRHMVTTIFARAFAERLTFSGTDGLDIYAHWEQEALSFISGLGGTATLENEFDMNADWSIDAHGNKYKFGLYHPGDIGNYNPPATLFMMYSPDGINTQVLGPVLVSSGAEADAMKARWKEELLKMKRSHVDNYSGGSYDTFRGTDEKGEYVYWGKYVFGGHLYQTGFQNTREGAEGYMQDSLKNQMNILNQNKAKYYIFLNAWKNFLQNNQNLEASDMGELYVYCLIMIELYERPDFRTVLFAEFPEFQNGGIQHIYTLKNDLEVYGAEIDQILVQLNLQLTAFLTPEVKGALLAIKDFMEGYEALADMQTYKDLIAFANDVFQSIKSGEILTDIIDTGHALYDIVRNFDEIVYSWSDDDIAQAKAYLATTIFLEYNPSGRASKILSKGAKRVSPNNTYIEMLSRAHLDLLARISHKVANPITTLDHLGQVTQVAQLKKKIRVTNLAERAELLRIRSLPNPADRGAAGDEFIRRLTDGEELKIKFHVDGLGDRIPDTRYFDTALQKRILVETKTFEKKVPINDFHRLQLRKDQALELRGEGRPVVFALGDGEDISSGYNDEATKNGIEVILLTLD